MILGLMASAGLHTMVVVLLTKLVPSLAHLIRMLLVTSAGTHTALLLVILAMADYSLQAMGKFVGLVALLVPLLVHLLEMMPMDDTQSVLGTMALPLVRVQQPYMDSIDRQV